MTNERPPIGPRDLARVFTAFHNVTYYAPEINTFTDAGMRGWWMAYFAYRPAPMGPVPAEVVIATFYNFAPRMVQRAVPAVWDVMAPAQIIALRDQLVDQALRRVLADHLTTPELAEAAQLGREAIEGCDMAGRPLYAAYTTLPWPDEPHRMLWHACTLLREHRGDSHNIALAAAEIDGVQAHVLMAAHGHGNKASILPIRGWNAEEWDTGVVQLVERGWLHDDGTFTTPGRAERREIERHTDRLVAEPFRRLGPQQAQRFVDLMVPYVDLLHSAGIVSQWPPPHLRRDE